MADIDVSIYYDRHRVEAMERILNSQRTDLETVIQEQMDALYEQIVPAQERAEIDERIRQERADRIAENEVSRRFAVVHLHDAQEDTHFISELHTSFYQTARLYRLVTKELPGPGSVQSRMRSAFLGHTPIAPEVFSEYCEAIPHDRRITALVEYDLENGVVGAFESGDNQWRSYPLKDVSAAVFRADRKMNLSVRERECVFREALSGKELELQDPDFSVDASEPTMRM